MIGPGSHVFELGHAFMVDRAAAGKGTPDEAKKRQTKCATILPMPASRCRVSYTDSEGSHSVEVHAETLYEAVAIAVAEFKQDQTVPHPPEPATELTVAVFRPPVEHKIKLAQVAKWAEPSTKDGPSGLLKRERVRILLGRT